MNFKDYFRSKKDNIIEEKVEMYPITNDSFLDVHHHYDKNDFIFEWKELLDSNRELWNKSLEKTSDDKKVLMITLGGGFSHRHIMNIDNLLNIALTLRGAKVETFICDHALPVCLKAEYAYIKPEVIHHSQISQTLCKGCYKDSAAVSLQLGLTTHMLSSYVTLEQRQQARELSQTIPVAEIKGYHINGVNVGKHATSGTIRYFSHSEPTQITLGEETLRRYFEASIITYHALIKILTENKYESVCLTHGVYMPHGVIKDICEHLKIPVVCWVVTCLKNRFIFSRGETLYSMLHEPNSSWENIKWGTSQEKVIMDYLNSRWGNTKDWLPIPKENIKISFKDFANEKKIDLNKPIVGLLTNIIWEAYAEYNSRIFPDMLTWLQKTISYFAKRKDLQLLIRIHPAEQMWNISRQPALIEINKMFPKLPSNIFIIESNTNVSTYEAMQHCDSVIIYQTQTGIELTAMDGIPVVVAGDAWIRNKDIAHEPSSEEEYFSCLNQMPFKSRLSDEKIQRARKYAYHAFYRKMIPLTFFEETKDWLLFKSKIKKLDELMPNVHKGLDIICDGLMNGTPFIYPDEEHTQEETT
ncbi:MAG: capsule biosynthesis protein [Gammaproteobacteria bacterium]|nr:capsule biosynthesis protein [Gammaproteobacteria bacterium]